jgi:hypothetical protein
MNKEIHIINIGCVANRELYQPNCETTELVIELNRTYKKKNIVLEDLLSFKNRGWEIHYKGKKSSKLHLVQAIYEGEI